RDEAPGRARAHGVRAGLGASMDEGRQRFHELGVEGTSTPFRLWESPAFRWPKSPHFEAPDRTRRGDPRGASARPGTGSSRRSIAPGAGEPPRKFVIASRSRALAMPAGV